MKKVKDWYIDGRVEHKDNWFVKLCTKPLDFLIEFQSWRITRDKKKKDEK